MTDLRTVSEDQLEAAQQDALKRKDTPHFVAIQEEILRRKGAPSAAEILAREEPSGWRKVATSLQRGLWLSGPIVALSLIAVFKDVQSLALFIWVGVILCLPWGIPGLLAMMWAGLAHGAPQPWATIAFWVGALWVAVSITVNGAAIAERRARGA